MRQRLDSSPVFFLLSFVVILVLKLPVLDQPPVWDGSMSVFPAAITLAENNFDLGHLLDQPGYADGGPNVHSISLVTWLTAAVIAIVGDGPALFPVLHVIHFAIAAAAMVAIYRLAQTVLPPTVSAMVSLASLLFPLVLTQAGYLYLEFPLLAATAFALLAWSRGRIGWAAVWAVVAAMTKESGIIVGAALAFASLVTPGLRMPRLRSVLLVAGPATLVTAAIAVNSSPGDSRSFLFHAWIMASYLLGVPDLLVLTLLFVVVTFLTLRKRAQNEPETASVEFGIVGLVVSFMTFYLALPLVTFSPVLPRYFIQIAPFMLIGLFVALERRAGERAAILAAVVLAALFVVNGNGRFYADNTSNNFAMLERSGAYTGLLELQQEGIRVLESLETEAPIFYAQPEHYKFTYPLMGYSNGPLPNGHSIRHEEPYKHGRLEDFPDEFFMLYEFPWLGGEIIRNVRDAADADAARRVEVIEISTGAFRSQLVHVTRSP